MAGVRWTDNWGGGSRGFHVDGEWAGFVAAAIARTGDGVFIGYIPQGTAPQVRLPGCDSLEEAKRVAEAWVAENPPTWEKWKPPEAGRRRVRDRPD
jgi:hypothetical protein